MQNVSVTLSLQEINAIMQVLGDLPTKSGAYPLVVKIKDQVDAQLPKQENQDANA